MSDEVERPIEDLQAGEAFRKSMVSRADAGVFSPYPLWHGWVIMDAFLAGIDYARRPPAPSPVAGVKDDVEPIATLRLAQDHSGDGSVLDALHDALSGWHYVRTRHGDLYGVGWQRVEDKLIAAIRSTLTAPTSPGVAEAMREALLTYQSAVAACLSAGGLIYDKDENVADWWTKIVTAQQIGAQVLRTSAPAGVETAEGWHLPETVAEFHAMMRHEFARDLQANDLADETGYSRSTVSRWVNGHTAPHKVVWPAIAQWIINKRGLNHLPLPAPPVKEG